MNFDDFEFKNRNSLLSIEYTLQMDELKNKFIDDLTNNEKYKEYFSKFDPASIPSFILHYAKTKIHLIGLFHIYLAQENHSKVLKYKEETVERFNWIKQKKLWDLQMLWRADKIKIKEIEHKYDFEFWGEHIEQCPFLSPITKEEVEVLKEYLKLNNIDYLYHLSPYEWQSYRNIMDKDDLGNIIDYPEFYTFYNEKLNKDFMFDLPNIREEKENYYWRIYDNKFTEERLEREKENPPLPYIPPPVEEHLRLSYQNAVEYAELYEKDKHFIELFKLSNDEFKHNNTLDPSWEYDDIIRVFNILKEAEVSAPMPPDSDWRNAIMKCTQQFINGRIIEELDTVYEEYLMFSELGIVSGISYEELMKEKPEKWYHALANGVLNGRELMGEPRDFNF